MKTPSGVICFDIMSRKTNLKREALPKRSLAALENFVALRKPNEQASYFRYSTELGDLICEAVANGNSISEIAKADDMPSERTIYQWIRTYPDMFRSYQLARERYADKLVQEALRIADDSSSDTMLDSNGKPIFNRENVNRSKLQVETRKWAAARFAPHLYGNKVEISTNPLPHPPASSGAQLARMRSIIEEFKKRGGDVRSLLNVIGLEEVITMPTSTD